MVTIAVAGGTSPTLGRSIVTAISQTSNTPIILSRSRPSSSTVHGAEVKAVDYTSHSSLVSALQGVHSVISVLLVLGPEWKTHQINLLHAAKEAGVKRFAPSDFELGPLADGKLDMLNFKSEVWDECKASGLECGRFSCGIFMNYLGLGMDFGGDEERRADVLQGLVDDPIIWDVANRVAEVPVKEDGSSSRLTLTDIGDIGRFVAAACELPDGKWVESMEMVGETLTCDQITQLLEEAAGIRIERRPVTVEHLRERIDGFDNYKEDIGEAVKRLMAQISMLMCEDREGAAILRPVVNQLCPQVKPISVREYLARAWKQ